jgi:hypothetical protein
MVLATVMVSAGAKSASTGILGFVGAVAGGVWGLLHTKVVSVKINMTSRPVFSLRDILLLIVLLLVTSGIFTYFFLLSPGQSGIRDTVMSFVGGIGFVFLFSGISCSTGKGLRLFYYLLKNEIMNKDYVIVKEAAHVSICSIISVIGMLMLYIYL